MQRPVIKTPRDIATLGTIMSVWAHPDDETFTSAGIITTAVNNGQQVACITVTKGEAGSQDEEKWPSATLADVRAKELNTALEILGCSNRYIFDYPDGACADVPIDEAVLRIRKLIMQFRPDTILTFGPEGITGHSDHIAVGQWAKKAIEELDFTPVIYHPIEIRWQYEKYMKKADGLFNIYFNIDEPPLKDPEECDIYFELPDFARKNKHQALAAMPSQMSELLSYLDQVAQDDLFAVEAFVRAD